MKVLVVTPWFPTESNPVAGVFHLRDVELLALDNTVTVVHLDESTHHVVEKNMSSSQGQSFRLIKVPYTLWNLTKVFKARKLIKKLMSNVDLIHTMSGPSIIPFWGLKVNRPWVHTEHWSAFTRLALTWREKFSLDVIKLNYDRPKVVVAVSSFLADYIKRARDRRVEIIGNFVSEASAPRYTRKSNLPLKIIGVGSVIESKGPHIAVQAVSYLNQRGISTDLTWLGEGPSKDYCQRLAADLGISSKVRFLGNVPSEQVQLELSQSDVFIAPTVLETFGVSIAEAMMNGLPIATGDRGGFLDYIQPAASRTINERTGAAYAEAIVELLNSETTPTREEIAQLAKTQFNESARRAKYKELYNSIKSLRVS